MSKKRTVISVGLLNILAGIALLCALRIIDFYLFNNNLSVYAYLLTGFGLSVFYPPLIIYSEYY